MNYVDRLKVALSFVRDADIERLADAVRAARVVLTAGNGGSAAIAQHFAADLASIGICAFDLLAPCKLTQIANDIGAEQMFARQVVPDALVIVFSCSGTSPNIVSALGSNTIRITSLRCKNASSHDIVVMSTDYEIIEDVFSAICHMVKKRLRS